MPDLMGGMLTNGLGGDCTAMILGPFRLKVFIDVEDDIVSNPGIGTSFPIDDVLDDKYQEGPKKRVTIMIKLGERNIEREYIVSKNRSDKIVKVANLVNKTLEDMRVTVANFNKRIKTITARFLPKNRD